VGRGRAAVSVLLAGVLAVVSGLAVGAVPASWGWAHDGRVLWGAVGGVAAASMVIGVLQARASADGEKPGSPAQLTKVRASGSGQAVGTNTGTVIHAGTVNIGPAPPGGTAGQAAATPGLDSGRGGDTLPARNQVFTGRAGALAELAERLAARGHNAAAALSVVMRDRNQAPDFWEQSGSGQASADAARCGHAR
jgi:hypothetical protein